MGVRCTNRKTISRERTMNEKKQNRKKKKKNITNFPIKRLRHKPSPGESTVFPSIHLVQFPKATRTLSSRHVLLLGYIGDKLISNSIKICQTLYKYQTTHDNRFAVLSSRVTAQIPKSVSKKPIGFRGQR